MIRLTTELLTLWQESAPEPTAPKVVPLTVRDQQRRRRANLRAWVLLILLALLLPVAGLWDAWDRQPMGEGRTERQQEVER